MSLRTFLTNNRVLIADTLLFAASYAMLYYAMRRSLGSHNPSTKASAGPRGSLLGSSSGWFSFLWRKKGRKDDIVGGGSGDTLTAAHESAIKALKERLATLELNEHEKVIAEEILTLPADELAGFESIGGLNDIVTDLREFVIFPLRFPHLYQNNKGGNTVATGGETAEQATTLHQQPAARRNNLLSPPRGVLFYGPPGCGKTMLARAIAKEARSTFLNIHISTLMDKWFGESQRLVSAVFSLARKLQPCIVFIDEIDTFLRSRRSTEHETLAMMKGEFLALWDGLNSSESDAVIVIGATNRPQDLDEAVLRRMAKRYEISLPGVAQREEILRLTLRDTTVNPNLNFQRVAERTSGMSGAEIKELCRSAAMIPFREMLRNANFNAEELEKTAQENPNGIAIRPLTEDDFLACLSTTSGDGENGDDEDTFEDAEASDPEL